MKPQQLREQFPVLDTKVYGKPLVYLDNAATSQRPKSVVDAFVTSCNTANSNLHRAVHKMAQDATDAYEGARRRVQEFIGAAHPEEIVFTSGATASINLVAYSFGEAFVGEGDEIIVTEAEHHSNIVPWQLLCERKKATLKVLEVDDNGELQIGHLRSLITHNTRLMAVTHVSNVLGIENPIREIAQICHENGVPVLVDGAQGAVHRRVNVQELDCDFYVFSGHKLFAASGTGVLYGKRLLLDAMPPFMGGGEMIETVKFTGSTWAKLPGKFEAGTQNINAVPSLVPALDLLDKCFSDAELVENQENIKGYIYDYLDNHPRITLYGCPAEMDRKVPLFSFKVEGAHHEDLALIMDKMGIALRSGQMCAEPLMDRLGVTGLLRASFAPYNTMEEAEYFTQCLEKAIGMLV
ncbi:MAG: SufS family cysteine desulfurase [Bacteroidales bacterium]|nr:SufS family cysteine desulfurase [Bacteroidales bacterium]